MADKTITQLYAANPITTPTANTLFEIEGDFGSGVTSGAIKFSDLLSSPSPIGDNTPNTGAFISLTSPTLSAPAGGRTLDFANTFGVVSAQLPADGSASITFPGRALVVGNFLVGSGDPALTSTLSSGAGGLVIAPGTTPNSVKIRNGANAQEFQVYNTYSDDADYERAVIKWNSNILEIGPQATGSGILRSVQLTLGPAPTLIIAGSTYYPHDTAGTLTWTTTP